MKIFVTGCAGLLGSNYSRHLLAAGHEVVGIDDLSGGYKAFVPKGEKFTFVKLNLERRKKVAELFKEHQPDVLIHFAAYAACLLYTSPSPRDLSTSRMPSSA